MRDIQGKTGKESSVVATYIKSLLDIGVVQKEVPIMDKPDSRRTLYRLDDGMFRFWYRFVYPNVSLIALDKGELVYNRIKPQITQFMGEAFAKICVEYMWSIYDDLPIRVQNIGRWWGNNPELKTQSEIDLIACGEDGEQAVFGECKWRNEPLNRAVVERLAAKSAMFRQFSRKYFYLFSKSGFTDGARELAREHGDVRLIDFDEMFE
jgi:AAA+ ATPase superfamily predicted ATPase